MKSKRMLGVLLCAGMLMPTVGAMFADAADTTGTYTMYYDDTKSKVYKTGTYDISAPETLDISITKDGYAFAGWNMDASYDVEKYYKTEEKILGTDEKMIDGVDYYVKTDVYSPLSCYLINGISDTVIPSDEYQEILGEAVTKSGKPQNGGFSLMMIGDNITNADLYAYYYNSSTNDTSTGYLKKVRENYTLTFGNPIQRNGSSIQNATLSDGINTYSPTSVQRWSTWGKIGATGAVIDNINYPALNIAAHNLFGEAYSMSRNPFPGGTFKDGDTVYVDAYTCQNNNSALWTDVINILGITALETDANIKTYSYYYPVIYNSSTLSEVKNYLVSADAVNSQMITSSAQGSIAKKAVFFKDESKSAKSIVKSKAEANGKTIYYLGKTEVTKEEYDANSSSPDYIIDTDSGTYTEGNVKTTPTTLYSTVNYYPIWVKYLTDFTIKKSYLDKYSTSTPQDAITPDVDTMQEDVEFTITPFKSFNREVGKTDIPVFSDASYAITADDGDDSVTVALPDFTSLGVGDYWYEVKETAGSTAGVDYDASTYYMHIVVTRESADTIGVTQVTMHMTAPNNDGTFENEIDDKTDTLTNKFASGSLTVSKKVEGNMADANKLFKVTVIFTAPEGKTVKGIITYSGGFYENGTAITETKISSGWTDSKTIEVYLKDSASIEFTNIPDGVTYTVVEDDYSDDNYKMPKFEFDNVSESGDVVASDDSVWAKNAANGSVSDESDVVTITNTKESSIDVGLIIEYAPYIILVAIAFAGGILLVIKKRREES